MAFNFAVSQGWPLGKTEICVGVYQLNIVDTLHDADTTNNISCAEFVIDEDRTSVAGSSNASVNVAIYPNPAKGLVFFDLTTPRQEAVKISILDLAGQVLVQSDAHSSHAKTKVGVDISALSAGMYLYTVTSAGAIMAKGKLQVQ